MLPDVLSACALASLRGGGVTLWGEGGLLAVVAVPPLMLWALVLLVAVSLLTAAAGAVRYEDAVAAVAASAGSGGKEDRPN